MDVRRGQPPMVEQDEVITEDNVYDKYDEPMGFFPGQVAVDLAVSFFLFIVITILAYMVPAPLTEPADISTSTYVPRPEWFFFFYDQMLMFFPGYALIPFGAVVIPFLFFVLLVMVPWLDPEPEYSLMKRPFIALIGFLVIVTVILNMFLTMIRIPNFPGG
jgi:quinol-cytochrome oxidoreductase complex cytochrome b subunit